MKMLRELFALIDFHQHYGKANNFIKHPGNKIFCGDYLAAVALYTDLEFHLFGSAGFGLVENTLCFFMGVFSV